MAGVKNVHIRRFPPHLRRPCVYLYCPVLTLYCVRRRHKMLALLSAACSFSMTPASAPIARLAKRSAIINMWTYEEAAVSGLDANYLQNLELRVGTLVAACQGDQCPLMPQQCIGDQCIPLSEYVRQLEELDRMLSASIQPQQYGQQKHGKYVYAAATETRCCCVCSNPVGSCIRIHCTRSSIHAS